MTPLQNVSLQVLGTGFISLGLQSISADHFVGIVATLFGIALYAVYEYFPTKTV